MKLSLHACPFRAVSFALTCSLAPVAVAGLKFPYVAWCTPLQEIPANFNSGALGGGTFLIDVSANTLTYFLVIGDLDGAESSATIDGPAEPGSVGAGTAFTLPLGSKKTGVWNYPPAIQDDLLAGRYYVQVKSTAWPSGELRGQIVTHVATLDGDQEVPPAATAAGGWGTFVMNPFTHSLKYHVVETNLCSFDTGSGIYGNAPHTVNGAQLVALPAGSVKSGTWSYVSQQTLEDGLLYVNIRTVCFPNGELRGQISRYVAGLDGSQEVPANPSSAAGVGLFSLQPSTATIGIHLLHSALAGSESTITLNGYAGRGATAPNLYTLPSSDGEPFRLGAYVYGTANESKVRAGLTYANIRSTAGINGEIRGQFEPPPYFCVGDLNGDRVVDLSDLSLVLANFGATGAGPESGELTGDGNIDLSDLSLELSLFGAVCP